MESRLFTLTSQDRHGVFVCEKVQQNEEPCSVSEMVQNRGMTKHTLVMVLALHIPRAIPEGEGLEKAVPRHWIAPGNGDSYEVRKNPQAHSERVFPSARFPGCFI